MTEARKTAAFVVAALVLTALAWATSPRTTPAASLEDRGQPFFPEFTDPNAATSLEVVEFDEQTSVARPFKVENRNGRWIIPSQRNYPADGGSRLASIAAALIALRKDDIAGENVSDQERCGVLDPLDETLPTPKGRGTRITVRGKNNQVLADVIAGSPVEGRPNFRYVRVPDQKRIYVARLENLDVSTDFEDWIERNLLLVDRKEIDEVVVRNYTTDPKSGNVEEHETLRLRKKGPGSEDTWTLDDAQPGEKINAFNMNLLVTRLVDLAIVDVRPKPAGVTATLSKAGDARITQADVADLAGKGFYFTQTGQLLSNQGEVLVHTTSGVFYVLRFGEIAYGVSAAAAAAANRYLFISVGFDSSAAGGTPPDDARARLDVLRARFAPWYYVVSDDNFKKIRLSRRELLLPPAAPRGAV
jgi:uncharacterized protein DUF4340